MRNGIRHLIVVVAVSLAGAAAAQERGVYLEDINRAADPCTDFFDYANGAWRKANPIPASMQRWSRRWQAGEKSKEQLHELLLDLSKKEWPAGSIDQQITDFFGACMDQKQIDALGVKPLQPLLREIRSIKDRQDVQSVMARLHAMQIAAPIAIASTPDPHETSQVIATLAVGGLGLPDRDYYLREDQRFVEARQKYQQHMVKMFELAGWSKAQAEEASQAVFALEKRLAEPQLDNVALRDPRATDHKYFLTTLEKIAPSLDWKRYLSAAGLQLTELNVEQPLFMAALDRELKSAPISQWKAYLAWHLLRAAAPHLSTAFAEENFNFYGRHLRGQKEMKPRWKRCVEFTDAYLGEALGQRYVERYFSPEAKARMQELVKNLLLAMGDTIRELDWMGPETKKRALEKLSTFNPKLGYPDRWKDYSTVSIDPRSHWNNVLAGMRYVSKDDWTQIGKPVDRTRWAMTPPTSNAYYSPLRQEIVFPAGILQPPVFDVNAADAINYGAIGVIIGHEISHGFDDQGAKFDAQGHLRNWWTEEDLRRFAERTQCVADQYEGYFIEPGLHHNGRLVLGESIGDLAGAKIAYQAFQKAQQTRPAKTIDGLTPDQQFFIAWGQARGDEIRPEMQRLMIQGDPHPVAKYRVIGPLSNLPEFARAFGCDADDPMVRKNRCEVW